LSELRSVRVLISRKLAAVLRARALRTGVELRLPSGPRYDVALIAVMRSGRRIDARYVYRACDRGTPTMLPARLGG
jgi:hypothetical protein